MHLNGNSPETLNRLGGSLVAIGQANSAQKAFQKAIEIDPNDYRKYLGLFFATSPRFAPSDVSRIELPADEAAGYLRSAGSLVEAEDFDGNYLVGMCYLSIDSLEASSYKKITGYDFSSDVLLGIRKAIEVGLQPVKINAVILKGINHSQVAALAGMSVNLPVTVRFIEYCPTNKCTRPATDYVPNAAVRAVIERKYGPLSGTVMDRGNGPAEYFKAPGSAGTIGFISGRSSTFCRSCSRLRLTSDGKVMPCLYSARAHDIKTLIRNGESDRQIRDFLSRIITEKANYTKSNSLKEEFSMCKIGG